MKTDQLKEIEYSILGIKKNTLNKPEIRKFKASELRCILEKVLKEDENRGLFFYRILLDETLPKYLVEDLKNAAKRISGFGSFVSISRETLYCFLNSQPHRILDPESETLYLQNFELTQQWFKTLISNY